MGTEASLERLRFCRVERRGAVTIVTLDRPEALNAIHYEAECELDRVWAGFAADRSQRVAILTGTGDRAFCAGNDLKAQVATASRPFLPSGFGALTSRTDLQKPVIAAVNGLAVGGGFEMALACDLIIAEEGAWFALPEPRVGLAPIMGGAQILARTLGLHRANGILLTGRRVGAIEARELGIVTALAPAGGALDEALRWAEDILACSPASLRVTRQVARESAFGAAFHLEMECARRLPAMEALRASPDYTEGPRAFAEKRKPRWEDI